MVTPIAATASARVWNGFDRVPSPPAAAESSTNQMTGLVATFTVAVTVAEHADGVGNPSSQMVYPNVTAPVYPGGGVIVNAPVALSTFTTPPEGVVPVTLPTERVVPSTSVAPTSRPLPAGTE